MIIIKNKDKFKYDNNYYFDVRYSQKETIKEYGGKWDSHYKLWYVAKNNDNLPTISKKYRVIDMEIE
jgi:hypothetical protein